MTDKILIKDLLSIFEQSNITFAFIVRGSDGELRASHSELEPLRDLIRRSPGFADHEAVFVGRDPLFKTLFFAFVHDTTRGLSQGGCRMKEYTDVADLLNDGLRLAHGMSRKNAISDLWWGGGKGIIAATEELVQENFGGNIKDQQKRDALFGAYGEFVAKLNGIYYTAADIGTYLPDMEAILRKNRFVTCIPPALGGSGDPSPHTADGVFRAIKTVREHLTGSDDLTGATVAVQGAGKVGKPLIKKLVDAGAEVSVSEVAFEINKIALETFQNEFPNVKIVSSAEGHENDILGLDVEIVAPCAIGGTINKETIERLKPTVKIVCGGANNILGDENEDGEILFQKGIIFVPDFLCNWMGIVNCANEPFGYLEEDVENALEHVRPIVNSVLEKSKAENISHTMAAHQLADEKIKEIPPLKLLQNRGRRLMENLINTRS